MAIEALQQKLRAEAEAKFLEQRQELGGGDYNWSYAYGNIFRAVTLPEGTILDIGANEGRLSRWLKNKGISRRVVSFDIRRIKKNRREEYVRGTSRSLPFADDSFRTVTSFYAIPEFSPTGKHEKESLREMIRVAEKQVIIWPVPLEWWPKGISDVKVGEARLIAKARNLTGNKEGVSYKLFRRNPYITYDSYILLMEKSNGQDPKTP